ncbi:hypothetical protein FQZ97_826040 [compost metagenome]
MCLSLNRPDAFKLGGRLIQHIGARQIGMIAIDPATGVDENDVAVLIKLLAIRAVRQRRRLTKRDNAKGGSATCAKFTMLLINKAYDI